MRYTLLFLMTASILFLPAGAFAKPENKGKDSASAHEKADKQKSKSDVEAKLKALPPGLKKKLLSGKSLPSGWQDKLKKGEVLPQEIIKEAKPAPKEIVDILPETKVETKTVVIADKVVRISAATKEVLDIFNLD